ncbi:MAG: hypothetical protein AABY22_02525 [Nanoarchaeota archaeon]
MKAYFVARCRNDVDLDGPVNQQAIAGKTKKEIVFDEITLDTHKILQANKADILVPFYGMMVGTFCAEIVPQERSRIRLTVERMGGQIRVPEYWLDIAAHQMPFRLIAYKGELLCWMVENYTEQKKISLVGMKPWSITVNMEIESLPA